MARKFLHLTAIAALTLSLSACAAKTNTQKGTLFGSGIGAGIGALAGQAIGGDTESTLIGAGLGAVLGGATGNRFGAYMDHQEAELQRVFASSEAASIKRTQEVLTAAFRSEVLFDFDSSSLKPAAYPEIRRVAKVLNDYPATNIRIEGHTDSRGSEEYNLWLSQKRAEAVKTALLQQRVSFSRLSAIGLGESQPMSASDALNRRVNIVIIPNGA